MGHLSAIPRLVDAVAYPSSHREAEEIMRAAVEENVCLIPFGGGTSVSGALMAEGGEQRMVVSVDMSRMSRLLWVDRENGVCGVEGGARGVSLEGELQRYGLTLGHEPDSWEFSTVSQKRREERSDFTSLGGRLGGYPLFRDEEEHLWQYRRPPDRCDSRHSHGHIHSQAAPSHPRPPLPLPPLFLPFLRPLPLSSPLPPPLPRPPLSSPRANGRAALWVRICEQRFSAVRGRLASSRRPFSRSNQSQRSRYSPHSSFRTLTVVSLKEGRKEGRKECGKRLFLSFLFCFCVCISFQAFVASALSSSPPSSPLPSV